MSHIGLAFREWAMKPEPDRSWFDGLPEWKQAEEVARLRERLARYEDEFEIRVSDDLRHGALCRACRELIVGTRADLSVIERDMRAHVCEEKRESASPSSFEKERVDEGADLAPFYSDAEREAMYRESQEPPE